MRHAYQLKKKAAAIMIQTAYRSFIARIGYIETIANVIECQGFVRRLIAIRHSEKLKLKRQKVHAATKIQSSYRAFYSRMKYFGLQLEKLRLIQSRTREKAVIMIQRISRGYFARISYIMVLMRIIITQSIARRWLEAKKVENLRVMQRTSAATIIQRRVRGFFAFNKYIEIVVNLIICQAVTRRFIASRRFESLKKQNAAAITIQRRFKTSQATSAYKKAVLSVIQCQAAVRRNLAINHSKKSREMHLIYANAATRIGATYRRHVAFSVYTTTLTDIILCQSYVRRWMASMEVTKMKCSMGGAAVLIQSAYRGYIQSTRFIMTLSRIILFQSQVRGYLAMKASRRTREKYAVAATSIQKRWRSFKVETDFM
jgi:hypothetical protein